MSPSQDDENFPPASRIIQEGGNLTIVNLGKEDYGQYECVATNVVTSVITTTLLIIEREYLRFVSTTGVLADAKEPFAMLGFSGLCSV